uniref:MAP7 domain-containing protein 1 n=1 Tax=Drosophila rhopaloa TaxID=1041015 RepID=A0A6P4EE92_DRORH
MAFLGRVDSQGALIDCEVFNFQPQQNPACPPGEDEASGRLPQRKGSRTYIKTYDKDSPLPSMGSPSTVRYVGSSVSSSETHSLDETESSTLRCSSLGSLGTLATMVGHHEDGLESESLCLDLDSPSSSPASGSSSRSTSSREGSSGDKDSTTSMCSWEEAMSREEEPHSFSLPSLRLGSEGGGGGGGFASPPLTYTRRLDPLHMERSADDAYENWLSGKRRQCQCRLRQEQAEREAQRERTALRQRLAKGEYERWCQQKARQAKPSPPAQIPQPKANAPAQHHQHLQKWELEKIRLAERRRLEQRDVERQREQEKALRRQQAEQAFRRWMSNVAQRPKPVPTSQGIQSLRGTVSDIFINPNQWVD